MAASEAGRTKRFAFNEELDLLLMDVVVKSNAHVSKYGEVEKAFGSVLSMFCASSSVLKAIEGGAPVPKLKTVRESFKSLIKKRRSVNKLNIAASGIAKDSTPLDEMLDSIIDEMENAKALEDEKKTMRRNKKRR